VPGDPFWDDVVCLAGFESSEPASFAEQSPLAQDVSFPDDQAAFRLGYSKFGAYGFHLDKMGGFNVPYNAAFLSGTTPFTVEFWCYLRANPTTGTRDVCGQWGQTVGAWWVTCNNDASGINYFRLNISNDGGNTADATMFTATALALAISTWHHIVIDFDGTKYRLYANGAMVDSTTASSSIFASSLPMFFGGRTDGGNASPWGGAAPLIVDDVRVTVGTARYASDAGLTVPTDPYPIDGTDPDWDDVVLRWTFDTATTVTDESDLAAVGGIGTRSNNVSVTTDEPKFGTKSLSMPGGNTAPTGGCLMFLPNAAYELGSNNFTIEGWFQFNADVISSGYTELAACYNYSDSLGWLLDTYDNGDGTWYMGLSLDSDFSTAGYSTGFTPFVADTWYFITCDYDGTDYRFYVNGVMVDKTTGALAPTASGFPLTIGGVTFTSADTDTDYDADDSDSLGGYVDEFRLTIGTARYANDGGFVAPTDAFDRGSGGGGPTIYDETFTEMLALDDAADSINFILQVLADTINISMTQTTLKPFSRTLTQNMVVSNSELLAARAFLRSLTDTAEFEDVPTTIWGVLVRDAVLLAALAAPAVTYNLALIQSIALQDLIRAGVSVDVAEEVIADAVTDALQALQVLEALEIAPQLVGQAIFGRSLVDSLRVLDALGRFLSGDILDAIEMIDPMTATALASGVILETLELDAAATPLWVLRAVLNESVDLTAEQALQMLFAPVVDETVELAGGYFEPNGGFTTWAMNTRTGAVTEYTNYAFNSFARIGDTYIGASDGGLYELFGDDDDGVDIGTRIKGGFMQFGSTHLSRLKAAYIATRGEGDFVLRIETGDGAVYNYTTSTRNMRSTKVHMGKGQRARYFAFELISTDGHDFDLDTLEFVPIVVQRRV